MYGRLHACMNVYMCACVKCVCLREYFEVGGGGGQHILFNDAHNPFFFKDHFP